MIEIVKASAGSGKTYHLAKTYIRLLLGDEDRTAYRHILAVTFTNRATEEMKSRILKELHLLAVSPAESPYFKDFVPSPLFPDAKALACKSGDVLSCIVHDYGAFAVSTIDRFFQQTLKAFSREIGQFASYQVELDKKSLVDESVDRVLDSISEDGKPLLNWMSEKAMDQLRQGSRYNLEGSLREMALRLRSDEHRTVAERYGIDDGQAYSKDNLSRLRRLLRDVSDRFVREIRHSAAEVERTFAAAGISPFDTTRGFLGRTLDKFKALDGRSGMPSLTDAFRASAADFSKWFKKADQPGFAALEEVLLPSVEAFCRCYDKALKPYNTARMLAGQISDLGVASELHREFTALMKEKNVLSLDDSNRILKDIIDGSDAPFIYEKMGVRFEHFLLDEFQDTSRIQWDNFKPLIANSDSQGFENLLVGDVKQSIYRWRGSDWRLMAEEVGQTFGNAEERSLKGNYRSLGSIVAFNNRFFSYAAAQLDSLYGPDAPFSVSSLYGVGKTDASGDRLDEQKVEAKDRATGNVEVLFFDSSEADLQLDKILETVETVRAAGARLGDIAILTRNNDDGSLIAGFLTDRQIDVVSDDSLMLKSSPTVRQLVSLISCVNNPQDAIGSYLAGESGLELEKMSFQSLPDLCEYLARLLQTRAEAAGPQAAEAFEGETQYILSFLDFVKEYAAAEGNALDGFLKAWDAADPSISSPPDADAVRIMTIHKSKGLEFPYVIFPFAESVGLFRPGNHWSVPEVEGTELAGLGGTAFDVNLSSGCAASFFDKDYRHELLLQYVDNINTFYVALTRASKGMTILAGGSAASEKNFAGILYSFLDSLSGDLGFVREADEYATRFSTGACYDFGKMERRTASAEEIRLSFSSWALNPESADPGEEVRERGRLKFCADAVDFFMGDPGSSPRQNGKILHEILSKIRVPSDLGDAVSSAFLSGELDRKSAEQAQELLAARIAAHPEWFPVEGTDTTVLAETDLIDTDGRTYRPDRVVIRNGAVTVIDYKFGGERAVYLRQVARYADIYRRLGFSSVSAAVWYVPRDVEVVWE